MRRRRPHPWGFAAEVLAPLLAALLLAASIAPCTAFAAPSGDPCKPHKATPAPAACIQLACQPMTTPAPAGEASAPVAFVTVAFRPSAALIEGLSVAPDTPPPKTAPATRD